MVYVIVESPVGNHRLYFGASRHLEGGDPSVDEWMDILIVPRLFVDFFVIVVVLALGLGGILGFCYFFSNSISDMM